MSAPIGAGGAGTVVLLVPAADYPDPWAWAYDVEAAALEAAGLAVEPVRWTEIDSAAAARADLVLPLVAWGYNLDYPRWLALLDAAETGGWPMANPPALLRWNGDKAYLEQLGAAGIATVPTVSVDALDEATLDAARAALGGPDVLVVKPPVSGGAEGTYRLARGEAIPAPVAGRRMMVQPFVPTIANGEWSLVLFGGQLSHCVLKTPRAGDFRVQPHLGGTDRAADPPDGALALAQAALAQAPGEALYARVDILADEAGVLRVMELELIEPALFLHHAGDGGAGFAAAVRSALAARQRAL